MPLAICATPIGNLDDVTLRVLDELRAADVVLCEDTRRTRVLLDRHGIACATSRATTGTTRRPVRARSLERLRAGERVALVSDAGLPGVNDPGARLIAAAVAEGVEVTVLPGRLRGRDRARRERARRRSVPVRRVPPAAGGRAAFARRRASSLGGSGRRLRVAAPPARVAARARGGAAGATGRGVPRAHEALRGGRARAARGARRAVCRAAARARSHSSSGRERAEPPQGDEDAARAAVAELVDAGAGRRDGRRGRLAPDRDVHGTTLYRGSL